MPRKEAMRSREVPRGGVWRRERTVPHLQHAEPYGTGCPSPPFPARRASQACHRSLREERPRQHTGAMLQKVAESNRWTLCRHLGSPTEWTGPRGTCHLSSRVCVRHGAHGRLREGWEGEWTGGKGAPNATPTPSRRVGWGLRVGARESRVHQDEDGRRRPLACEQRGTKGPSARASCTRVDPRGTGDMGSDASWSSHGERSQVLSRVRSKPQARFSTGRMRKQAVRHCALSLPNSLASASSRT